MIRFSQDMSDNSWWIAAGLIVGIIATVLIATIVNDKGDDSATAAKSADDTSLVIGNPAEYENINPYCPNGEVTVKVPSDTSSAKIKEIAGELFVKNKGCRIMIEVVPVTGFTASKKPSEQVMGTTVVISCDDPNDCPPNYACAIGAQVCVPRPKLLP